MLVQEARRGILLTLAIFIGMILNYEKTKRLLKGI